MSITYKMLVNRDKLPASGKKIVDWVITQPEKVIPLTSQELAKSIDVSQSSIVKFTQRLGFSGYSQFKQVLLEEVSRKSVVQHSPLHTNISVDDSTSTIIQKLIRAKSD